LHGLAIHVQVLPTLRAGFQIGQGFAGIEAAKIAEAVLTQNSVQPLRDCS
jgi:hypothetical protein